MRLKLPLADHWQHFIGEILPYLLGGWTYFRTLSKLYERKHSHCLKPRPLHCFMYSTCQLKVYVQRSSDDRSTVRPFSENGVLAPSSLPFCFSFADSRPWQQCFQQLKTHVKNQLLHRFMNHFPYHSISVLAPY